MFVSKFKCLKSDQSEEVTVENIESTADCCTKELKTNRPGVMMSYHRNDVEARKATVRRE